MAEVERDGMPVIWEIPSPFPGPTSKIGRELGKVQIEEGWRWQGPWCHVAD